MKEKRSPQINSDVKVRSESGKICAEKKLTFQSATSAIAKTGILTALSFILYMFVKFPLPFMFPSFLDIQISDLPALLGGFAMGPVSACAIILLKCLLKMPFSTSACVGELGDILIGIAFVLPAALIYKYRKNKKGALLGILLGAVCCILTAVIVNRFLLIPFYVTAMFGGEWSVLLNMVKPLYPAVTEGSFYAYYLGLGIAPFNALRCLICGGLTFLTYKPLSKTLHWEIKVKK